MNDFSVSPANCNAPFVTNQPTNGRREKVVLAYSGGVDTTTIIVWLIEQFNYEVVCCCLKCGQDDNFDELEQRAKLAGASKVYVEDIVDTFCDDFIAPCLKAGAIYENKYLLGTAMARPAMVLRLVEVANREGATIIVHGCTGKGNDQLRFEAGIMALAPDIKVIAPWRLPEWTDRFRSRKDCIDYCRNHGVIDDSFDANAAYSCDSNLWHISYEGLDLEDPSQAPNYPQMLQRCSTIEGALNHAETITISFVAGTPTAIDDRTMKLADIIDELNHLGGQHGIGVVDIVENRVVGMKSRGVYETPGGTILMEAHAYLEELILDRDTAAAKRNLGNQFVQLVYDGKWFTPLREAIQAFVDVTQEHVTGKVKLKLYKGNIIRQGATSPYSLYNESIASFATGELYNPQDANGFIQLFNLPSKVRAYQQVERDAATTA